MMWSERLEFITSTVGSLILAHFYALLERWLNWELVHNFFKALPSIGPITPYHYLFMLTLFILIGGLPLLDDLIDRSHRKFIYAGTLWMLGNAALTALIEDMAYFYLYGTWIKPTNWTANIIGHITINNIVIPNWYFISIAAVIIFYTTAIKQLSLKLQT